MRIELTSKIFITIISISVVVVIVATGYKFLWLKDYNFIVEAKCNPNTQECFYRDCSVPDDCPPSRLENYRIFEVSANDFPKCSESSCLNECSNKTILCQEILCGEAEGDECSVPDASPLDGESSEENLAPENSSLEADEENIII